MQREQDAPASVSEVAEARERLELSESIRQDTGIEHNYPLRAQDLETVETFAAEFGELPPRSYLLRLLWWIRGG